MRFLPVLLLFALPACGGDEPAETPAGTAQGEVLPGSASDAMLPLDTVRSQAPLAPKPAAKAAPSEAADEDAPAAPATDAE